MLNEAGILKEHLVLLQDHWTEDLKVSQTLYEAKLKKGPVEQIPITDWQTG